MGVDAGVPLEIPVAVERINSRQKTLLGEKIAARFGSDLSGRCFGVWGLAFKPRTDDVREAPALVLIRQLLDAGAEVRATDPEAISSAKKALAGTPGLDRLTFVESSMDAAQGADAVILVTEWSEFRNPDFEALAGVMRSRVFYDGRNVLVAEVVQSAGFEYHGVGRNSAKRV